MLGLGTTLLGGNDIPAWANDPSYSWLAALWPGAWPADTTQADIQKAAGAGTPNYNPTLASNMYSAYQQDATSLSVLQAQSNSTSDWVLAGVVGVGLAVVVMMIGGK